MNQEEELNETNQESLPSFSATDIIITSHGKHYHNQGERGEVEEQQNLQQQQFLARESENSFCKGLLQFLAEQDTTTAIIKRKIQQQIKPPRDTTNRISTKQRLDDNSSRIYVQEADHRYGDKENKSGMENQTVQYQQQQQQYDAKTIAIKSFYLDLQRQMKASNRSQEQSGQSTLPQPSMPLQQQPPKYTGQQGYSGKQAEQSSTNNLHTSTTNSQPLANRNDDLLWIVNRLRNIKEQIQEVQEVIRFKRQQLVIQSTNQHNVNHGNTTNNYDNTQIDKLSASTAFLVGKYDQAQADLKVLEQETKIHQQSQKEQPQNQEIQRKEEEGREDRNNREKMAYHNDGMCHSYSLFAHSQPSQDKHNQQSIIPKLDQDKANEFLSSSSIGQYYQPVTDRVSQIVKEQMQQQISNSNGKQQQQLQEQQQSQSQQQQRYQFQLCSPNNSIFSRSPNIPNQTVPGLSSSASYSSSSHRINTMNNTNNKKNNSSFSELSSSSARLQTTASNVSDRNTVGSMGIPPVTTSAFSIQAKAQTRQSNNKQSSSIPRMRSEKSINNNTSSSNNNRSITQKNHLLMVQQPQQGYLNNGLISQRDLQRQLSVRELEMKDNCQRQTRSMSYQEKYALLKAQNAKGKRQQQEGQRT